MIEVNDKLMSPDEYRGYTRNTNGIDISWYSYTEYLGIPSEQVEKDRLTTDYDKLCWKYYQETLDRMKQWEREEAKEKLLD